MKLKLCADILAVKKTSNVHHETAIIKKKRKNTNAINLN